MDEAVAAVAVHLGETDEDKINQMSYVWFQAILGALGKKLNFESVSNLLGNAFAKDAGKVVAAANPLVKEGGSSNPRGVLGLMGQIKVINTSDKNAQKKSAEAQLGDLSWAEGLF